MKLTVGILFVSCCGQLVVVFWFWLVAHYRLHALMTKYEAAHRDLPTFGLFSLADSMSLLYTQKGREKCRSDSGLEELRQRAAKAFSRMLMAMGVFCGCLLLLVGILMLWPEPKS